jgi:hypothetical protein
VILMRSRRTFLIACGTPVLLVMAIAGPLPGRASAKSVPAAMSQRPAPPARPSATLR